MYLSRTFPYERLRRIAEESSLMDKYIDYSLLHRQFVEKSRYLLTPAINGFLSAAEDSQRGNFPFKFSISMSGLFIEQMLKEDTALVASITRLVGLGALEILTTPYYHSLSSLYRGGAEEFEEQVRETSQLIKKVFGVEPKSLVNTELIYTDSVAKSAEAMGLTGVMADDVPSIAAPGSQKIYSSGSYPGVRIILRNHQLSHAFIRGDFDASDLAYPGFNTIFIDSEDLPRADVSAYRNMAISLVQRGIRTMLPWEMIESSLPSGNISVPDAVGSASFELNGSVSSLLENPMQRMFYERVEALHPYVKEIDDARIKGLWRILQQADLLYCMSNGASVPNPGVYSSPADAFSICNTVLVDFEGKVGTLVQRIRKAKLQASVAAAQRQQVQPGPIMTKTTDVALQQKPIQMT
jgi:alpha-amylase